MIKTGFESFNVTELRSSGTGDYPMDRFTISDDRMSYLCMDAVYDAEQNEVRCSVKLGDDRHSPNQRLFMSLHTYKGIDSNCRLVPLEAPTTRYEGEGCLVKGEVWIEGLGNDRHKILDYSAVTGRGGEWIEVEAEVCWSDMHKSIAKMYFDWCP